MRLAALLVASAPGPLLFAFTSTDGGYALLLSAPGAVPLLSLYPRSPVLGGVAGFGLGPPRGSPRGR